MGIESGLLPSLNSGWSSSELSTPTGSTSPRLQTGVYCLCMPRRCSAIERQPLPNHKRVCNTKTVSLSGAARLLIFFAAIKSPLCNECCCLFWACRVLQVCLQCNHQPKFSSPWKQLSSFITHFFLQIAEPCFPLLLWLPIMRRWGMWLMRKKRTIVKPDHLGRKEEEAHMDCHSWKIINSHSFLSPFPEEFL